MKKALVSIVILIALGIAYYLLSPLWNVIERDDAFPIPPATESPQARQDRTGMDHLSTEEQQAFEREMAIMKDNVMIKEERLSDASPSVLSEASFVASAHDVQGKALLIEQPSGKILRFEAFETINGPDLRIYLSSDLDVKDAVDLGPIRGTKGNINYVLQPSVDTQRYRNVLVWCRRFGILFSYAKLQS